MRKVYKILNGFECCGKQMVTVIIDTKAVSVMPLTEFERIVGKERKFFKKNPIERGIYV